jgi:hypothetical protein
VLNNRKKREEMLGEVLEEAKNVTGAIRGTFFIGTQTLHN